MTSNARQVSSSSAPGTASLRSDGKPTAASSSISAAVSPSRAVSAHASKPTSSAQSLSASLLVHLLQFLNDGRSLARIHAVCRNWNQLGDHQLDLCWKPLFRREWP